MQVVKIDSVHLRGARLGRSCDSDCTAPATVLEVGCLTIGPRTSLDIAGGLTPSLQTKPPRMHEVCVRYWQGVGTREILGIHPPLARTRSYDVEPRPASAEGTLPDVRGRPAGSYRHCVVVGCRFGMDFDD